MLEKLIFSRQMRFYLFTSILSNAVQMYFILKTTKESPLNTGFPPEQPSTFALRKWSRIKQNSDLHQGNAVFNGTCQVQSKSIWRWDVGGFLFLKKHSLSSIYNLEHSMTCSSHLLRVIIYFTVCFKKQRWQPPF